MTKGANKAPERCIRIETYDGLHQYIRAFAAGHLNLLILLGGPGLAKSQTVKRMVGKRACWIEGNATAFGMYMRFGSTGTNSSSSTTSTTSTVIAVPCGFSNASAKPMRQNNSPGTPPRRD